MRIFSISVFATLATFVVGSAFGESPYELPSASYDQTQTVSGTSGSYQVNLGGTLDEFNTASYPDTYGGQKQILSWFQPNEHMVLENTGDVNIVNPRVVINGRRNWHSVDELLASILKPGMTDAEKAMAIWGFTSSIEVQCHENNRRVDEPYPKVKESPSLGSFKERGNPIKAANSYYCSGCSLSAANFVVLCRATSMDSRTVWMSPIDAYGTHCVSEVYYDGGWHLFDPERRSFYLEADNTTVASYETMSNNPSLVTRTWDSGFPGDGMVSHDVDYQKFFPPNIMPVDNWQSTMDMTLRPGEKFIWRWDDINKYRCGDNPRNITPDRPEGLKPYQLANGKMVYTPNFRADILARDVVSLENVEPVEVPGQGLCLQPVVCGEPGSVVYQVSSPYPIVGGLVGGSFFRQSVNDDLTASLSVHYGETPDDQWTDWTEIWSADTTGHITQYVSIDEALDPKPNDAIYDYRVKFELEASSAPSAAQLRVAYFETDVQMAGTALPSLSVGANNVVYSDSSGPGSQIRITHGWKESSATRPPLAPADAVTPGDGQSVNLQGFDKLCWQAALDPDGQAINNYHVQISPRTDFLHPVSPNLDRLTHSGSPEWDLPHGWLNGGQEYYWRVRAQDASGAWSGWSNPFSFTAVGTYVPPPIELMGHWKFDGNLNDEEGSFHGTAVGNAVAGTSNGAFAGSGAVYFDGSNDAVTIDGDVLGSSKFSIAFWSKTDPTDTDGYFLADGDDYTNLFLRRYTVNDNSTFAGRINTIDIVFGPDGTVDTSWSKDVWHHHVLTYGEGGVIQWHVNGQMMDTGNADNEFLGLVGDLYLGNREDLTRDFKGWLDDLQIYNGALSEAQVQWLYANPGETLCFGGLPGDANGDGTVNNLDAAILAANWQSGPGAIWNQGDFNGDGYVDDLDATILASNWQANAVANNNSVPEPSILVLCAGTVFALPVLRYCLFRHAKTISPTITRCHGQNTQSGLLDTQKSSCKY